MRVSLYALSLAAAIAFAQQPSKLNRDPDAARLITSDIPNFWKVFGSASLVDAGDRFQREYIDSGTAGLHNFLEGRIRNGRTLASVVAARPRYYAAIRSNTLAIVETPQVTEAIRKSFHRLHEIYPEAVFPDVYFVIGRMNSAGTVSSNGLLIGVEMNARDERTPVDELTDWERAVTGQIANLPEIVAHELIHIQQPQESGNSTLLDRSLHEGAADFVGELISGGIINRVQRTYGNAHEQDLWREFQKDMSGTESSHWLYQGDRSKDRPADLGYYMGFKICEAFYERSDDKRAAVHRIVNITSGADFLKESGYNGGH
ncbi:MAG TPA: DUF2268 domain-containing putative Zn-dependent protease [Bryobacteraceae bacterium]|jgi:hypothetical protein